MPLLGQLRSAASFALALLCIAGPAHGLGALNLRVGGCVGGGGSQSLANQCNSNVGNFQFVGSIVLSAPLSQFSSLEFKLDVISTLDSLPPWWHLENGGCRQSAFGITSTLDAYCSDVWQGNPTLHVQQATLDPIDPKRLHIQGVFALPAGSEVDLPGDGISELAALGLSISKTKSTGSNACAGCNWGARLELLEVKLNRVGQTTPVVLVPSAGGDNVVEYLNSQGFTATSLSVSPNPSELGTPLTLAAQVSPSAATGMVTFSQGATVIDSVALTNGSATIVLAPPSHGQHVLTAAYTGNANYAPSSGSSQATVNLHPTTTTLTSYPNPSLAAQVVHLAATVSPETANGTLTFLDGGEVLGTVLVVNGGAAIETANLSAGSHNLNARFNSDSSYYQSSTSAPLVHQVALRPTSLILTSSSDTTNLAQPLTLTATVAPDSVTGEISFADGAAIVGTALLVQGTAQLSIATLCGGSHALAATFMGDSVYSQSVSSTVPHTVRATSTSAVLTSSVNPSQLTQVVRITARVQHAVSGACPPSGAMNFIVDGSPVGSPVPVSGDTASVTIAPAVGTHAIVAVYLGDQSYSSSMSESLHQVVSSPAPRIVSVRDVAGDQGGRVKVQWDGSYYDRAPYNTIDSYWLLRSVPATAATLRLEQGERLYRAEASSVVLRPGALVTSNDGDSTHYWEFVVSLPAFHVAKYSHVAATTCDSTASGNPYTFFMIQARTVGGTDWWFSNADSGYSVDNLAPVAPQGFVATYSAGAVSLGWLPNAESDVATYRIYRGEVPHFVPSSENLIAEVSDASYRDPLGHSAIYKITALDLHGNEGPSAVAQPSGALSVGSEPRSLALTGVRPNPAVGPSLLVEFALPTGGPARLDLLDIAGRRVATVEVGSLGAGAHAVDLRDGRQLPAGLYLVRLVQAGQTIVRRVAILQ